VARSTLEQIAELSGVSRSTVSRVVNDDPRVSEATREHVLDVIRTEGYRPNLAARGLASGTTNVIAAVMPGAVDSILADPFFVNLLHGMAVAADERDHFVMLSLGGSGFRHTVDEIARQGVVAGIVFVAGQVDDPLLEPLVASQTPMVSVGRSEDDRVSYIDVDNRGSAQQITSHLLRLGHRRVATIAGPSFAPAAVDRLDGYRAAIEAFGARGDETLICEGEFSEAGGRAAMRTLLEHRPDAVFAASDRMAAGALNEIRAAGLRVPHDIALAGFDDMPLAAEMEPPLTTIRQRPEKLGEAALSLLLDRIAAPASPSQRVILPTELIVRASCGSLQDQRERQ
jgi:LacI family transcriptional regulator